LNDSLLFSIMSVGMHFRQRLRTRRALLEFHRRSSSCLSA
jgi:hypothetical protein